MSNWLMACATSVEISARFGCSILSLTLRCRMFAVAHRGVAVTHTRVHRHRRRESVECRAFDVVVVEDLL
jgi:hypothetical protein